MEVLPCSGVSYTADSDCPDQGSGTSFMFAGESNRVERPEEVQATEFKVDDLEINLEGPLEEREDGSKWSLEGLPASEVNNNGDAYYAYEMDGQKFSFDSHDSEDEKSIAQDHMMETCLDTYERGQPSGDQEPGLSPSESKWHERDESLAVWVKWRGKWQAGIRCARADWPLSTLKAKPTHDRKKYLVIFFPRTRNYSWADELLVRPMNEFPEPIAYKTHKVGMKMVKDLTLARRFVMQKLAVSMLSILDQLHSEALIETARNVAAWKEFALEASRCKNYSDLGKMLLKLQNMILQCCINADWLQHSLPSWIQRCQNANSAECVEILKEELVESIVWDEVHSLSNATAQLDLSTEWRTWKHEVMKWFSMSNPISSGGDLEQPSNDSPLTVGIQMSRKRPKLEVRRAEMHGSQAQVIQSSHQDVAVEIDSAFFNGDLNNTASLDSEPSKDSVSVEATAQPISPGTVADRWAEIVVETGNSDVMQLKNVELTTESGAICVSSSDAVGKSRQCIAFIEHKGRRCVRWANEGDVYCCVHLTSRFSGSLSKIESATPVDSPMCEGTTVLGTKCKHRSLLGSSFCKKHRPKDDQGITSSLPENRLKRKHEESSMRSETTDCKEIVISGGNEAPLHVKPIQVIGGEAFDRSCSLALPEQPREDYSIQEMAHCIGLWSQDGFEPCQESPKRHSLYCEKHIPSWLKRARNGKSRIISKEVFMELLKDCRLMEQKLNLHQACELFYRLFKSILSLRNPVPKEVQFQWVLSEASKDVRVGQFLLMLVCSEKARLESLWGFSVKENLQASTSLDEPVTVPMVVENDQNNENSIKCKLCSENFLDDQTLGTHWMDHHKKEAQWLFRGYVCAICLDSFTNKKVLETHVQERHRVQFVEQCMLFQCIPCSSHFGNPEDLWSHVLSVHPNNFKQSSVVEQPNLSVVDDTLQNPSQEKSAAVDDRNPESQSSIRKYICRFCGLKFDLLPDLGRHHQAAHMGPTPADPRLPKRGLRLYAQKLKSGRLTRPGFRKGIGSASYRIRNRSAQNMKKHIQATSLVSAAKFNVQSVQPDAASLGRLADSQCSAVAKVLFSEIKRTKPRPSNLEILSIARLACCKVSLQASLAAKYGTLPERIYLKAAKLCSEQNILVNWHQEGFICPRGCRPIESAHQLSSSVPLLDDVVVSRSLVPLNPVSSEWTMDECHYVIDSRHFNQDSAERIILCDDISFGKESVPIACVVDENLLGSLHIMPDGSDGQITAHSLPWESFTYVTKPLLDQSIGLEVESSQLGCACAHSVCSPVTCDHVYLFDNDYEDAKDIYGKPMHGRFPYDERGRIILEEGYLVYECNQRCCCSKTCQNRVLQNGIRVKLEIFKTEKKGWAVRAREAILRGTFVCEYIGEVINEQEASERRNRYGNDSCRFLYEIDAQINDISRLTEGQVSFVIDTTNYGNVSRYINHSCSPNLVNHQVIVESMDCQLAHIGLYASRDIAMGEELTYDYRYKLLPGEGSPCLCGAANCRGRLY
ncbi:histone-lysine N-methyltransferase SUVR5 isoform X1 [Coffea eugenioides]|uniref:histone-lysine N-methyltransferase SUVR5 isoform X1 n=1 Tax=Coffea eugenioides TaxID=49369 RepID=UPI000F608F41|nr:histone-lysine N-methyltransferase SUVR5 isoform X1 [Coffea eugenioides]XP_027151737.1 histone-lysine N-methyltransferase SUVR5 isoform X1 [Coffea eugenioides]XP_027151739.1 histone-lysine N-methyltransferase SUVR5 isoform X1 [Coffea eugenioides]